MPPKGPLEEAAAAVAAAVAAPPAAGWGAKGSGPGSKPASRSGTSVRRALAKALFELLSALKTSSRAAIIGAQPAAEAALRAATSSSAGVGARPLLVHLAEAWVALLAAGDGRALRPTVEWATGLAGGKDAPGAVKMCVADRGRGGAGRWLRLCGVSV